MARQVKGCPVCGRRYQGSLADHLDKRLKDSGGITRCEWNLNEYRITRGADLMRGAGWVRAGTAVAPTARLVRRLGLARMVASGDISTKVHARYLSPAEDIRCWWVRSWVFPVARIGAWPVRQRVQVITDLLPDEAAQAVVEAAFRVGGPDAVAQLEGGVIPYRCGDLFAEPRRSNVMPRGGLPSRDRCIMARDHLGVHVGTRAGQTWWPGGFTSGWGEDQEDRDAQFKRLASC